MSFLFIDSAAPSLIIITALLLHVTPLLLPLSEAARVGQHQGVPHLIQLVPHLGRPPTYFAGSDKACGFGWFGYSVFISELFLRKGEGILHL